MSGKIYVNTVHSTCYVYTNMFTINGIIKCETILANFYENSSENIYVNIPRKEKLQTQSNVKMIITLIKTNEFSFNTHTQKLMHLQLSVYI